MLPDSCSAAVARKHRGRSFYGNPRFLSNSYFRPRTRSAPGGSKRSAENTARLVSNGDKRQDPTPITAQALDAARNRDRISGTGVATTHQRRRQSADGGIAALHRAANFLPSRGQFR